MIKFISTVAMARLERQIVLGLGLFWGVLLTAVSESFNTLLNAFKIIGVNVLISVHSSTQAFVRLLFFSKPAVPLEKTSRLSKFNAQPQVAVQDVVDARPIKLVNTSQVPLTNSIDVSLHPVVENFEEHIERVIERTCLRRIYICSLSITDDRYVNASSYSILRSSLRISEARDYRQRSGDEYDIIISFRQSREKQASISNQLISAHLHKVDSAMPSRSENPSVRLEEDWENPIVTKVMYCHTALADVHDLKTHTHYTPDQPSIFFQLSCIIPEQACDFVQI